MGTARADYGPSGYDPTTGKGDVTCVGGDALQFLGNFLADGSPFAHAGFNANGAKHDKLVSIDGTGDASARFSYAQTQTVTNLTPSALDPSVILRSQSFPAQRPNGSGAGYNALINDVTTTAQEKINCVLGSSYPSAQNFTSAQNNGWGGLHVVRAAIDPLGIAAALTTNAPAGLSASELVPIYQGVSQTWGDIPGYSGSCPSCTIVPMVPQPGSGTRNTFLTDLRAANGGVPIVLGANVLQGTEENDPTAITNLPAAEVPNAIVPFSGSRLTLWNKGYFRNPHTPLNNNPFPGGATLTAGVDLRDNTAPDGAPSYIDIRGLFIAWRASDDNALPWANNSATVNWAKTLFLGPTSFLGRSITGAGPVNDSGAFYAYQDCGVNIAPAPPNCANVLNEKSVTVGNRIGTLGGGIPIVNVHQQTPFSVTGPAGCQVGWNLTGNGPPPFSINGPPPPITESPPGFYYGMIPVVPHGLALLTVTLTCPGGVVIVYQQFIYFDPSGTVVDMYNEPIAGATVTLLRDDGTGTFTAVRNGDTSVMSPDNTKNPDSTFADGKFGWDVVAGTYKVRAQAPGCTAPGGSPGYVETPPLSIPPEVTGLVMQLSCIPETTTPTVSVTGTATTTSTATVTFTATDPDDIDT
ncbi:MAG TPA: substrate-binding domain-containing protein, partial [Actinomycetota bacterium]